MVLNSDNRGLNSAVQDFRRARNQADLQEMLARLKGETNQLLSFDEVRKSLGLQGSTARGLQDIPLDAIVGSVGRYSDFTRDFLPLRDIDPERWARVKIAASGLVGLPPIQVYKIGEVYFVEDGNHRVSVARQLGATHIQAYVNEVAIRAPLTPDVKPDDLILIAEYNNFLGITHLNELRPEANLRLTAPGKYPLLLEHIQVHRYYMGLDLKREISYPEAVVHWYDAVYLPVTRIIREQSVLHHFPGRTETDLYLWIAEQRANIEEQLGWKIPVEYAANALLEQHSLDKHGIISWISEKFIDRIVPRKLEAGPPVGQWRSIVSIAREGDCLFRDILVPINGRQESWNALEQAIVVARREGSQLHGLYVVKTDARRDSPAARKVKEKFEERCKQANVAGELTIAVHDHVSHEICQRAGFTDLIVTNLAHPPSEGVLARLNSGFRELILRCPRPILATPQTFNELERALVAYDGSPMAKEALYLAAYLAENWNLSLILMTVSENDSAASQATLKEARQYLEAHGAQVTAILESSPVAEAILRVAQEQHCDLIMMGGYGLSPVLEMVLGSEVNRVLRESRIPMLICR